MELVATNGFKRFIDRSRFTRGTEGGEETQRDTEILVYSPRYLSALCAPAVNWPLSIDQYIWNRNMALNAINYE
jgi:hypothetical protein